MSEFYQVMTTTDSTESANTLAEKVVGARLAACAQVSGPIQSTYWWDDKVTAEQEWVVAMKTVAERTDDLIAFVKANHSYDTPEIVALPIEAGYERYLNWIIAETAQ